MNKNVICNLCRVTAVDFFDINENKELNIKQIIQKHFYSIYLGISKGDAKVCQDCWDHVNEFHEFYLKVEKANKDLVDVISDSLQTQEEIKEEYRLPNIKIEPIEYLEVKALIHADSCTDDKPDDDDDYEEEEEEEKPKAPKKRKSRSETPKVRKKRSKKTKKEKNSDGEDGTEKKDKYADYDNVIREFIAIRCQVCDEEFETFVGMKHHCRREHDTEGFIECCGKQYKRRTDMRTHALEHKYPEKYLVCDICHKQFKFKKNMEAHKEFVHAPDSERQYGCDKCPKRFSKMSLLNSHLATHGEKEIPCLEPGCGKLFVTKNHLYLHMKTHQTTSNFMCDICSKPFKLMKGLKKHMITHSNEKTQCTICGAWVKDVKTHSQIHVAVELQCPECGKVVNSAPALKSHILYSHKTERNLSCTFCDKTFKKALNLKEHIATHTGEALYTCPTCPRTFISSSNLYKHKKMCVQSRISNHLLDF